MKKKIKLLILTDINVSNVHLMLASILKDFEEWEVSFLNVRSPITHFDDSRWYDTSIQPFDISSRLNTSNLMGRLAKVIHVISQHDVVFCTGAVANLAILCNKPYIYFCTGSDLDQYSKYGCSFFEYIDTDISLLRRMQWPIKKYLYQTAIKKADLTVIAPYQYPEIYKLGYSRLGFFPHPLEQEYFMIELSEKDYISHQIKDKYRCKWALFSPTRHIWDDVYKNESDYKGNNITIKSFSLLIKEYNLIDAKLFLVEKGLDIPKSKQYIQELGIENNVVWLEPMNRKELINFYAGADVCFDQFSQGCLALCAVESLACGTPTVSYIGSYNYKEIPFYSESPPIINSKDPQLISSYIYDILNNYDMRHELQRQSYYWVKKHCTYEQINAAFLEMVNSISKGYLI